MTTKCIQAKGSLDTHGYGRVKIAGKSYGAHVVAWQNINGRIPSDMQIDHLCRNRTCINVEHLELVTQKENILRGAGIAAVNATKTHCKRGHEFTAKNTYLLAGKRACRTCHSEYERNRRIAKRGEA